jgi:hypothetical protein
MAGEIQIRNRRQKRWLILLGLGLVLLATVACLLTTTGSTKLADAAVITFVRMTNSPNGHYPFALFCVSNTAPYAIVFRDHPFEVEGNQNLRAPIVNSSLPESMWKQHSIGAHSSLLVAFGEPEDVEPGVRWRPIIRYSHYGWRERYFSWAAPRDWPLRIGPIVLATPEVIFSPTNQASIYGPWLVHERP